jgi:subtilisin family serine protease
MSNLQPTLSAIGYAKVIVKLKPPAPPAPAAFASPTEAEVARVPRYDRAATEAALAPFFMAPDESQAASLAAAAESHASRKFSRPTPLRSRRVRVYANLGLALGTVSADQATALANNELVDRVEPAPELSLIRPVASTPAKLGAAPTWGITRIKADQLWAAGITGKGVVVGHLDTGVDGAHPALQGAIAAFAEFDFAGDQVPGAKAHDSGEHGTHTAGTIVGRAGTKGPFGVAPQAQLATALVIEGGQAIDRILAGLDWIVGQHVHVLSMSLGLRGFNPAFQVVIDALRAAGVLPVIAVGNEGANTSRSPGNYTNVLSIGAMDKADEVADFSGSQLFDRTANPMVPDLVAPGVGVLSSVPEGGFREMDGTSMATPHVAGLAALLLQAKPTATTDELEKAILNSCALPAGMSGPRANKGVPDAVQAFTLLTGSAPPVSMAASLPKKPARRKPKAGAGRQAAASRGRTGRGPRKPAKGAAAAVKRRKKTS